MVDKKIVIMFIDTPQSNEPLIQTERDQMNKNYFILCSGVRDIGSIPFCPHKF